MKNNENLPALEIPNDLTVAVGTFIFPNYDQVKSNIIAIRDFVKNIEVSEDGIKESKKLVASISKDVKALNDVRIEAKKLYLEPYETVNEQCKELTQIAREAEGFLRTQIRAFEEKEREEKEAELESIFGRRKKAYEYSELLEFKDFFKPSYANKSFSINKAEQEMVEWFEQRKNDLDSLKVQCETNKEFTEYLNIYFNQAGLSLSQTLLNKKEQEREVEKLYEKVKAKPKRPVKNKKEFVNKKALIEILDKDLEKVTAMLNTMEIEYKVID